MAAKGGLDIELQLMGLLTASRLEGLSKQLGRSVLLSRAAADEDEQYSFAVAL